jgi:hypothetical protein
MPAAIIIGRRGDPEDKTTYMFIRGDLARRDDLASVETRNGLLPFNTRELLALLDGSSLFHGG